MTKNTVKKHCSILNYLRRVDNDLFELVQDLCLGRMFSPRRNSNGVTFLHPSKALYKDLLKMAQSNKPEDAVDYLQSLIVVDYLPSISDFESRKDDIPTFKGKKLLFKDFAKAKATLKDGGVITPNVEFIPRDDRDNMVIYNLDKALVKPDSPDAEYKYKDKGKAVVKGGAVFSADRKKLFEDVLRASCVNDRNGKDSAMECLVSILKAAVDCNDDDRYQSICSQLSWDTITSLAIVLQPYRTKLTKDTQYVSVAMLQKLQEKYSVDGVLGSMWAYVKNPYAEYKKCMDSCSCDVSVVRDVLHDAVDRTSKITIIRDVNSAYGRLSSVVGDLPGVRRNVLSDKHLCLAECELRIMGAITLQNIMGFQDSEELLAVYKKHNLDAPHIANVNIKSCNLAYYLSTANLMLSSDGFFYLPGLVTNGVNLGQWLNDTSQCVRLDKMVVNTLSEGYYGDMKLTDEQKALILQLHESITSGV